MCIHCANSYVPYFTLTRATHLIQQLLLYPLLVLILKSPRQGAQTSIYCAVAEELEGVSGRHFHDCQDANLILPPSLDRAAAEKLWDISMKMTEMKPLDDTE